MKPGQQLSVFKFDVKNLIVVKGVFEKDYRIWHCPWDSVRVCRQ